MNDAKMMMKMANFIRDQIGRLQHERLSENSFRLGEFYAKVERISKDARLYKTAIQHGWIAAAQSIQTRSRRNVNDLNYAIKTLETYLDQDTKTPPVLSDVLAELIQLEDEYGQLQYNWKEKTLSMTTEPIVLEDVALGSFEIKLFLERIGQLGKDSPYRIVALDPNPAGSDSGITHPHVSHERLCEGDGHLPIRMALEQGRLCDFFELVKGVLNTYNPGSPYIALSEWNGFSCYDCGSTVSREDSYYCEQCDNDFCDSCSTYCHICNQTICLGCATECPSCLKPVCRDCITVCRECHTALCNDCMDGKEICDQCEQESEEYENEDEQTNSTAA